MAPPSSPPPPPPPSGAPTPSRRSPTQVLPPSTADAVANPILWERAPVLTPRRRVVTGGADTDAVASAQKDYLTALRSLRERPLLVFIHEDADACDGSCGNGCRNYFDVEQQVFENARVLIAAKAFRPVWMLPSEAAEEGLLADAGSTIVPSLLLVDARRQKAQRLHGGNLRASRVYEAMRKMADRFYGRDLDDLMDRHLAFCQEQDRLDRESERLTERIGHASSASKRERLAEELDLVHAERRAVERKIELLWDLEPRSV